MQHSQGVRMKQLFTKDSFSLKPLALPMRKVLGRECGLAAVSSAIQSHVQRKHVYLFRVCRIWVTSTSHADISGTSLKTP